MTKRYSKKKQAILNSIPIFLSKTYQIVDVLTNDIQNPQYSDIISWSDDKQAFVIKDVAALTGTVLPKHFKHNNFASFVRQLNMYGFHKVRSNNEEGHVFQHQYFKKDNMDLLPQIKRKNATGTVGNHYANNNKIQQQANQGQMVLAVPKSNRQLQLQRKIQQISQKQQQLQNIVEILVGQNKQVITQNRNFVSRMNKMDQKYRKKLQTLIWMVLMAGRGNSDKPLMIPPQAINMIKALKDGDDSDSQGFSAIDFKTIQSQNKNDKGSSSNALQKYSRKKAQKIGNNSININQQNVDDLLARMLKNDSEAQLSGMQHSNQNLHLAQQNSVDSLLKKMNGKSSQNSLNKLGFDSKSLLKGQSQDKEHFNDHIIPPSPNNSFLQPPASPIRSQKNELSELLDHINDDDFQYVQN